MATAQIGKGSEPRNNRRKIGMPDGLPSTGSEKSLPASNPAPPIKPHKSMALIKGKLKLGPGFGINLSEKGISPYFTTPLGPVDAGVTCVPTTIKGVRFSIGGKNPADIFINALRQMGRPAKLPKPGIKLALTRTHT